MHCIISATNRPKSYTYQVALVVHQIYQKLGGETELISLTKIPFEPLIQNPYPNSLPQPLRTVVNKLNHSDSLIIVCPEYNGSFPGIFKFFFDHWDYPQTFKRPMCFVGLGGRFGNLRGIEQLQQIMSNLNAFIYPKKVYLQNIRNIVQKNRIVDDNFMTLLQQQAKGFLSFVSDVSTSKNKLN